MADGKTAVKKYHNGSSGVYAYVLNITYSGDNFVCSGYSSKCSSMGMSPIGTTGGYGNFNASDSYFSGYKYITDVSGCSPVSTYVVNGRWGTGGGINPNAGLCAYY